MPNPVGIHLHRQKYVICVYGEILQGILAAMRVLNVVTIGFFSSE